MPQDLSFSAQLLQVKMQCLEVQMAAWNWSSGDPPWVQRGADGRFGGGSSGSSEVEPEGTKEKQQILPSVQKNLSTTFKQLFGKTMPELFDKLQTGVTGLSKPTSTGEVPLVQVGIVSATIASTIAIGMLGSKAAKRETVKELKDAAKALAEELRKTLPALEEDEVIRSKMTQHGVEQLRREAQWFMEVQDQELKAAIGDVEEKIGDLDTPLVQNYNRIMSALQRMASANNEKAFKAQKDILSEIRDDLAGDIEGLHYAVSDAQETYLKRFRDFEDSSVFQSLYQGVQEDLDLVKKTFPDALQEEHTLPAYTKLQKKTAEASKVSDLDEEFARLDAAEEKARRKQSLRDDLKDFPLEVRQKAGASIEDDFDVDDDFEELADDFEEAVQQAESDALKKLDEIKSFNPPGFRIDDVISKVLADEAPKIATHEIPPFDVATDHVDDLLEMLKSTTDPQVLHGAMRKFNRLAADYISQRQKAPTQFQKAIQDLEDKIKKAGGVASVGAIKKKIRVDAKVDQIYKDAGVEGVKITPNFKDSGTLLDVDSEGITHQLADKIGKVKFPEGTSPYVLAAHEQVRIQAKQAAYSNEIDHLKQSLKDAQEIIKKEVETAQSVANNQVGNRLARLQERKEALVRQVRQKSSEARVRSNLPMATALGQAVTAAIGVAAVRTYRAKARSRNEQSAVK
jgi:hypothetical protein